MAKTRTTTVEPTRRSERIQTAKAVEKAKQEALAKITKPKRFRRPRQRKNCHLLALPGELRNKIYRFALLEPDNEAVIVTAKGPGLPPLLRTCKRVRKEGSTIYYGENDFNFHVRDYNGAAFTEFAHQRRWQGPWIPKGEITFRLLGAPHWDNLMEWLKANHFKNAHIPQLEEPMDRVDRIVDGAIKIAEAMRFSPWERKEEALKGLYDSLKGTCSAWVKREDRDHR